MTNFYFHCARFEVDKHQLKQPLSRKLFYTMFDKKGLKRVLDLV